jgi:hypothetical protein
MKTGPALGRCEVRIGRVVVDAPPGTDRAALARELAASLPAAIGTRLTGQASPPGAAATVSQRVADAVAARVAASGVVPIPAAGKGAP